VAAKCIEEKDGQQLIGVDFPHFEEFGMEVHNVIDGSREGDVRNEMFVECFSDDVDLGK
jgi:hypothetical protein